MPGVALKEEEPGADRDWRRQRLGHRDWRRLAQRLGHRDWRRQRLAQTEAPITGDLLSFLKLAKSVYKAAIAQVELCGGETT